MKLNIFGILEELLISQSVLSVSEALTAEYEELVSENRRLVEVQIVHSRSVPNVNVECSSRRTQRRPIVSLKEFSEWRLLF